jgi:hypothetical protein
VQVCWLSQQQQQQQQLHWEPCRGYVQELVQSLARQVQLQLEQRLPPGPGHSKHLQEQAAALL